MWIQKEERREKAKKRDEEKRMKQEKQWAWESRRDKIINLACSCREEMGRKNDEEGAKAAIANNMLLFKQQLMYSYII